MPYIRPEQRRRFDGFVENLPHGMSKGQANYLISKIVDKLFGLGGYSTFCDGIGTLEAVKLEYYRRLVSKYEDHKKEQSGEVYMLPYTAGLFDGEGCISIYKPSKRKGYHLSACIANSDLNVLEKVKDFLRCGRIYSAYPKRNGCKQVHKLYFTQKQTLHFLETLYPYLIIKKEEAKIAIEFQQKKLDIGTGSKNIKWQKEYYSKLKEKKWGHKEEVVEKD